MNEILQFVLASLVIFLFGLGLIFLSYLSVKERNYIKKYGVEVMGEIIGERAFYDLGYDKGFGREKTSYYITCKYVIIGNEEITKEFTDVSYRRKHRLKHPIGSKIKIIYLPESPYRSIIKSAVLDEFLILFRVLGICLFILSAFVLYNGLLMFK